MKAWDPFFIVDYNLIAYSKSSFKIVEIVLFNVSSGIFTRCRGLGMGSPMFFPAADRQESRGKEMF